MAIDIRVTGSWGFYLISPATPKGRQWQRRHLTGGERTVTDSGDTACEGGDRIRHIVRGAIKDGLSVTVNGTIAKDLGAELGAE